MEANLGNPFEHLPFIVTGEEELIVIVLGVGMILPGKPERGKLKLLDFSVT